jgi:mRNA interferase RelE/StbE
MSTPYRVRFLDSAKRDLKRLDKAISRRIIERIEWLAFNLEDVTLEQLSSNLAGLYKLRAGDYRIIYQILHDEQTLLIHEIGHRREIYKS